MKETIAFAPFVLALACAGCASPVHDEIVVRAYDGPPPAREQTEILSGLCDGRRTELRFVTGRDETPGQFILVVEGRKVADLSDTPLGRDWTSSSVILKKGMRCSRNFIRVAANGVQIGADGAGRLVYSEASLTDGKVTAYQPFREQDVDYWKTFP